MLVYKKGELIRELIPIGNNLFTLKLSHLDSGLNIDTEFSKDLPSRSYYKIYKEVDGKFKIFKEFLAGKKETKLDNFKNAVAFFEMKILEELNEKPQNATPPVSQNDKKPETFSKIPEVGDIIRVNNEFGRVVDVNGTNVSFKELSKKEAMDILREQYNQLLQQNFKFGGSVNNNVSDLVSELMMEIGGEISTIKTYDAEKVKFIILQVKPQQEVSNDVTPSPPDDGENETEKEPQPDNVQDPFDKENDINDSPESDSDGNDSDGNDSDVDDSNGDDSDGDDSDGDDSDSDDSDGNDEDSKDSGKNKSKGKSKKGKDLEEDDFGDDDLQPDLESILKKALDDIEKGKNLNDIKINNDINAIEKALNSTKLKIKNQFKTPSLAIIGIGKQKIFTTDNQERIKQAINKIFE
jgi:hypothetical protein